MGAFSISMACRRAALCSSPRPPLIATHPPARPAQVLAKLQSQLQAGNYYEAHEMFKTVVARHRARKNFADSYQLAEVGGMAPLLPLPTAAASRRQSVSRHAPAHAPTQQWSVCVAVLHCRRRDPSYSCSRAS